MDDKYHREKTKRNFIHKLLGEKTEAITPIDKASQIIYGNDLTKDTFKYGIGLHVVKLSSDILFKSDMVLDFSNCVNLKQIKIYNDDIGVSEINLVKSSTTSTIEFKDLVCEIRKNVQYIPGETLYIDRSYIGMHPITIKLPKEEIQSSSLIINIEDILKEKDHEYIFILDLNNKTTISIDRSYIGMEPIFLNLIEDNTKETTHMNDGLFIDILNPDTRDIDAYWGLVKPEDIYGGYEDVECKGIIIRKRPRDFHPIKIQIIEP